MSKNEHSGNVPTRRDVLLTGAAAGIGLSASWVFSTRKAQAAPLPAIVDPLYVNPIGDPAAIPQYVNVLKNALDDDFVYAGTNSFDIDMAKTTQNVIGGGLGLLTTVYGYSGVSRAGGGGPTFPGRTFEVTTGAPVTVNWSTSDLRVNGGHLLPVDTTLHWAYSVKSGSIAADGVPVVPHQHGGFTESDSDGLPEYYFTNTGFEGPRYVKQDYTYSGEQPAGTIWYHDHALGLTRLNVYAGLAGFFILRDGMDTGKPDNPLGLPTHPYEIPIVIQDRMFYPDGSLAYPDVTWASVPGFDVFPGGPTVQPEFFGLVMVVNGQAWPRAIVEPRIYRLRFLNGCDSRFLQMKLGGGLTFVVIGNDSGLLNVPVETNELVIGPGERYDVLVDFSRAGEKTIELRNLGKLPFPKGRVVDPRLDGRVMAFEVGTTVNDTANNVLPTTLGTFVQPLGPSVRERNLLLFEATDRFGRLQPLLGVINSPAGGAQPNDPLDGTQLWDDAITENPQAGTIETWNVYNATADAHPIHLHLVRFQILSRQKFRGTILPKNNIDPMHPARTPTLGGILTNIRLNGQPKPADPVESRWKDTAQMFPGEVTRIQARFDLPTGQGTPARYVWHCHILSHEDHEMMRPYEVV